MNKKILTALLILAHSPIVALANDCKVASTSCAKVDVIDARLGHYQISNQCAFPIIYTSKNTDGQRMYTNPIKPSTSENVGASKKDVIVFDASNGYLTDTCLRMHKLIGNE